MLDSSWIALVIATVFGFLAGLGVGGGSLLIMWLTLVLGMQHPQARILNLVFFIPTAVISSFFRWKQGSLNIKKILPAVLAGCISSAVFSVFTRYWEPDLLQKIFGSLLLFAGARELFYKSNNK